MHVEENIKVQNLQNETDRKQTLIYTNVDWLEGQELNTTKSTWATKSGATILPLEMKDPRFTLDPKHCQIIGWKDYRLKTYSAEWALTI